MLRRLGNGLLALAIMAAVAAAAHWGWQRFESARDGGRAPAATARTSRVYAIDGEAWTRFPLPRPATPLRVLAHADRPREGVDPATDEPVEFAIRVQAVGADGAILLDRVHHFQAGLSWYEVPNEPGTVRPGKFYADRSGVPTNTQRAVLDLPKPDAVRAVRIKAVDNGPAVTSVNVRVYAPDRLSGAKLRARWTRLSAEQRARLAEGNVYPPELLVATERAQLATVRWRRLGPAGIAGQDYRERTLYVREEGEVATLSQPVQPQGVRVGPHRRASVRLPEGGGDFAIAFRALDAAAGQARAIAYDGADGEVAREAVAWRGEALRIERDWSGRLLELRSDVPAIVRLLPRSGADAPPQPEPGIVRVYRADAGPRWRVRHASDGPTPYRLDLRCACFGPDGERKTTGSARIEMVGPDGKIVERTSVTVDAPLSFYDQVRRDEIDALVSEAQSLYFRVPTGVTALRVTGDATVSAAAFNRPGGLRRTIEVPEYRFAREPDALREHRSWFYRAPEAIPPESPASTVISVQEPPPEIDPLIRAGDYEWTSYRPAGDWAARRLLTPTDAPDPERRPEALASTYTRLGTGTTRTLTIAAASPRPVRPNLVFTGNEAGRSEVRVRVDGETILTRPLRSASGRLTLPELSLGPRRVRIETSGEARFYLSNVTGGGGPTYGLNLANRMAPGTTRFVFEKTADGAQLISFRFHPALPATGRRQVDVTIGEAAVTDAGPHADLTLRRRRYDLRLASRPAYPVLGTGGTLVGAERRFVAELGADLPPGRYPITINLHGSGEAYMTFATATPGRREARGLRRGGEE